MKRVCLVSNVPDGLYTQRSELIERLDADYEIHVVADANSPYVPQFEGVEVTFHDVPIRRRGRSVVEDLKLIRRYHRTLKAIAPDVVLTYTIKPNVYGGWVCRALGIPYLVNVTGLGSLIGSAPMMRRVLVGLYGASIRHAACTFLQNENNLAFLRAHGIEPRNPVRIPGSGVNLATFAAQPYPDEDPIRFLYVGRLMLEKGLGELMAVIPRIRQRCPGAEFHFVGSPEQDCRDRLETWAAMPGVFFHGHQNDLRPFYRQSHCLLHPSWYGEGMSNACLEAAASARPVLTTWNPGCQETVDDGVSGILVQPRSVEALQAGIARFLALSTGARRAMGMAGRAKMERAFDRNLVVDAYLREMTEAMARDEG